MSAKHTAGLWRFLEEGRTEEPGNACRPLTICDEAGNDLANVYSADDSTVDAPRDQAIANARLIAAAPTMFGYIQLMAANGDPDAIEIMETINVDN